MKLKLTIFQLVSALSASLDWEGAGEECEHNEPDDKEEGERLPSYEIVT